MNFRELLKTVPGLEVRYNNGMAKVISVDWQTETVRLKLGHNVNHTVDYYGKQLHFISDGDGIAQVMIEDLERQNY